MDKMVKISMVDENGIKHSYVYRDYTQYQPDGDDEYWDGTEDVVIFPRPNDKFTTVIEN